MISLKSIITQKILNYFFNNPEQKLYVNEISRTLNLDKRNLVKKLKQLEEENLLGSYIQGNIKFYFINKKFPLYEEYKRIIAVTIGVEDRIKKILYDCKEVKHAYIYGSYAQNSMDQYSDIDVLVIGNHNIVELIRKLNIIQKEISR
ncbi:nucleotidyltransferase domain-containing protein, partial [bacterium]